MKNFVCFSLIHCINSITFNRPDQNYILSCRLFIRKYPTVQYVSQHWITMKTIEDCPPPDPSCCCPAHMSFIKLVFRPLRTSQLGNTPFVLCADLHTRRKYFPVRLLWKITTLSPCFCIDFFFFNNCPTLPVNMLITWYRCIMSYFWWNLLIFFFTKCEKFGTTVRG